MSNLKNPEFIKRVEIMPTQLKIIGIISIVLGAAFGSVSMLLCIRKLGNDLIKDFPIENK